MIFSNQVLSMPIEQLVSLCEYGIQYQLTSNELSWLDFVSGRYAIADAIKAATNENGVLTIDSYAFSEAMDQDNGNSEGFAACLSRESALARILWTGYINPND